MTRTTRRPLTEHQENVLNALRRLRSNGRYPASAIEVGREAGFTERRVPYAKSVDGHRTTSPAVRVQSALTALIDHGLVERTSSRGGGRGTAFRVAPNPEDFARWVVSIEEDERLIKTVTLRQIVSAAREALGE